MSYNNNYIQLRDVITVKHGFAFKSEFFTESWTPYQLVTPGNFAIGGGFQLGKPKYYSGPIPDSYLLQPDDLVVTMTDLSKAGDTLGYSGLIPYNTDINWLHNQRVGLVELKTTELADLGYVYYLMRTADYRHWILATSTGSTVKHTAPNRILDYSCKLPALKTQKAIANILSVIDKRIDLLKNTNQTLEALAQTLFKSWFVNFDPVHAKQQSIACAGIDAATAELFPNSFEDSELGQIPKGWEVMNVGQVATITKGKSYTSAELVPNEETALVTLKSFVRGGGFRLDGFKPYIGKFKPEQVVKSGDLIVAYTDVTQDAALIGKPAIVIGVERYSTLVASLDLGIIRALDNISSTQFLYGLFKMDNFQSHTYAHTSGTTVLHMSKDAISSYKFVNPPNRLMKKFSAIAETLSQRIQINNSQILNLAELRDTILPRLISGKLDVSAIEAQLEETA